MNELEHLSYWEKKVWKNTFDLVVVGSGITGATTAIQFKKRNPNKKVLIIEKRQLGFGASSKNAGFICLGSPSELINTLENSGEKILEELIRKKYHGIQILLRTFGAASVQASFQGGYEVFNNSELKEHVCGNLDKLNKIFQKVTKIDKQFSISPTPLHLFQNESIKINFEGKLDSSKLLESIHRKLAILNIQTLYGCSVLEYEEKNDLMNIETSIGEIKSKKLLFATNAFSGESPTNLPVKPGRGFIKVTEALKIPFPNQNFHVDRGYTYFRKVDGNRLLIGGFRNLDKETEETTDVGTNPIIDQAINSLTESNILGFSPKWEHQWNGWMGFTENETPILKKIGNHTIAAVGMNGMGVALAPFMATDALKLLG